MQNVTNSINAVVNDEIKKYKAKECTFQDLMKVYETCKEYYVNVSYALKTYDRQSYKEALDKMYNSIMDLKKKHEPRKRFRFSRRDGDFGVKENEIAEESKISEDYSANVPGVFHRKGEKIVIKEGWTSIGSYKIMECEDCEI